jgi:hypothetical protein
VILNWDVLVRRVIGGCNSIVLSMFQSYLNKLSLVPWVFGLGGIGAIAGGPFDATSGGLQIGMFIGFCLGIAAPDILEERAKKSARRAAQLARRQMDRSKRRSEKVSGIGSNWHEHKTWKNLFGRRCNLNPYLPIGVILTRNAR